MRSYKTVIQVSLIAIMGTGCAHLARHEQAQQDANQLESDLNRAARDYDSLAKRHQKQSVQLAEENEFGDATTDFVERLQRLKPTSTWNGTFRLPGIASDEPAYAIHFDSAESGHRTWTACYFNEFPSVSPLKLKEDPLHPQGVGAPMVAHRTERPGKLATDPNWSPRGIYLPTTVMLQFGAKRSGQPRDVSLRFYDPRELRSTEIHGHRMQFAADFAAPAKSNLAVRSLKQEALLGLLRPERYIKTRGLYLLEPYRRDKIPVLLIHGLQSDPHVWENLTAALMADPKIGSRFQFWYFAYPTGMPVPASAAALRKAIADLEAHYDPDHTAMSSKHMVIIGHSMGGLLARMQVIDSGDAFWRAYFTKPLRELTMSARLQRLACSLLYFDHCPAIDQVIFITTPQRGSDFADNSIGRFFASLIAIPTHSFQNITEILMLNSDALNSKLWRFRNLGATSIDTLSPNHPYFSALASRPIQTRYYSIIADRGRGDAPNSSDGVVPYWSSHLAGAASETIVPYGHGCVEQPLVIDEVRRILISRPK